jgi:regulator of protease activity HflC (stomatin/prohibitin superfamily)
MIFALKFIVFLLLLAAGVFMSMRITRRPEIVRGQPTGDTETVVTPRFGGIVAAAVLMVLFFTLQAGVSSLAAGYVGVVTRYGAVTGRTIQPGIYLVNPLAESVEEMDVQIHAHAAKASAVSKDMQTVTTELTLNYSVKPEAAGQVFQTLRREYVERVLVPSVQESVKATTAAFSAEELITKRPVVSEQLAKIIVTKLDSHGIFVDQVSITDFDFSEEFNNAIEAKVTAVQKALQAQNELVQAEAEAQKHIAKAQGEAEAIRIQAEAISKQGGQAYVDLKWIERWDGKLPTTQFGSNATPLVTLGGGK